MSHVFISYSKKNRDSARRLADDIQQHGFDIWIDDRIDYGSSWEREIQDAIRDCAAFVVLMTPESAASDWVRNECALADLLDKPQYPVLLSGDPFFRYMSTQYVDARASGLPPDHFYADLEQSAARKAIPGVKKTTQTLSPIAPASEAPAPKAVRQSRRALWIGLSIVLVIAIVTGLYLVTRPVYDDSDALRLADALGTMLPVTDGSSAYVVQDVQGLLEVDQTETGQIAAQRVHVWGFTASAGDRVTIRANALDDTMDPVIELYNEDYVHLISDDESGGEHNARIGPYTIPTDGLYHLFLLDYDHTGGYYELTLTVQ
jgi:hypothetical protein